MRLDGVEVKVNLDGHQTAAAVKALGLPDVPTWSIFFVEDIMTRLGSSAPLLDHHLIIRARQKTNGKDDVTVKFRPGRRSQLAARWLAMAKSTDGDLEAELKVEQDWAGERRSLAVSLTAERPDGLLATAANEGGVAALLTDDQHQLIDECAEVRVNVDVLTMLPAVSAMRWPTFAAPGPAGSELKVRAERWAVSSLDFLELSIAVGVDDAEAAQDALEAFVDSKGLQMTHGEAKTSQVMQLLVEQGASATH